MHKPTDSSTGKVARGLIAAAGAVLGIGVGALYMGTGGRLRGSTQPSAPPVDNRPAVPSILERLDRIEARLRDVQTRLTPVESSVANLESRLERHARDIEALQIQTNEVRQKEMDAEVARLGALFLEMKHPLFTSRMTH